MEIARISSKGQIVIPLRIRNEMGINQGSVMAIEKINDVMVIKKMNTDLLEQFKKSLEDLKMGKIKRVA
ncbi:MAG: AbrB/MazE/SpoVT family DNA-binding domain-containing protein [Nanoarchaeota archaeon]|nr:AbrB/MazE/SpoVT family DNA-binding domain-containing protein [Nanoarchaeota archaeon]MBU4308209.1 AbrB/MazE/SpoVT family DNA-binding domain-containing protein [Nanoarchaeota archaeon]